MALHLVRELRARGQASAWLTCAAAFFGGALIGVLTPAGGGTPAANAVVPMKRLPQHEIRLDSTLPDWLAPGARLTVTGWAGPAQKVSLVVAGRRVGSATSGELGHFQVAGRVAGAGRPLVEVTSDGKRVRAGRVLVRPLLLAAGGDVTPGEGVSEAVSRYGEAYPWTGVARVLRAADIATVNLEGAISSRGVPAAGKEYHFRGGPGLLRGAARVAGIDLVTVANNHSLDYGRDAFMDTLAAAKSAGLATVGGGATIDLARRPAVLEAGGLRIAVLGYSDVRPYGFDAGPDWAGAAPADPAAIAADVATARRNADLVIVWFHWGEELQTQPNGQQQALAAAALGAGASVVLGAHPHVLQPVTRQGRKLVAWSLGNFVFPSGRSQTRSTAVLVASLDAYGVKGFRLARATIEGFRPVLDAPPARNVASARTR